jgi:tRNA(Ile)-lysidine synthase
MLDLSRAQVLDYLQDLGAVYRIDSSNYDLSIPRNRIRYQLVPLLESLNPGFREHVVRLSRVLGQEDALVEDLALDALNKCTTYAGNDRMGISLSCFMGLVEPLKRRVVLRAAERIGRAGSLSAAVLERVVRYTTPGVEEKPTGDSKVLFSSAAVTIKIEYGNILVEKTVVDEEIGDYLYRVVSVPSSLYIRELGRTVRCTVTGADTDMRGSGMHLDWEKVSLPLVVRNRRRDDRIVLKLDRASGRKCAGGREANRITGTRKLKDLFIDQKIPRALRDLIPVLETEGCLAAVFCSLYRKDNRVSFPYRVTAKSTRVLKVELIPQQGGHDPTD